MSYVFLGGSRKLSFINIKMKMRLKNLIKNKHFILVGDAYGADKAIQLFLATEDYQDVMVYCMDNKCRNNIGGWAVKSINSEAKNSTKNFFYFSQKDIQMSRDAEYGFMFWDGKSKGTLNNLINLLQQKKYILVYFSPTQSFIAIKSMYDLHQLIASCNIESKNNFKQLINAVQSTQIIQKPLLF